ncbi:MAG: LysM peptidoglycan-binding domain-containing protein, partial [Clostridiales bacterium]|nr:LysM peptidoglycan-binding domain-containing protein [Clostridiales bacterium]
GFFGAKGVVGETEPAGERRKNPEKSRTKKEERWKDPDEKKSQQERRGGWLSSASTAAAVLVLAWMLGAGSGIWQQNWAKKSESPVMSGEAAEVWNGSEGISGEAAEAWNGSEGISGDAAEVRNGEDRADSTVLQDSGESGETGEGSESRNVSDEDAEAGYSVHYVRDGETLASICLQYYGTMDMVDMVCEWNHISDPNYIIEGQAIRLPILSGETAENT